MLNKLLGFIRKNNLIARGDRVVCAVSGGADSVALLFALHLLQEQLGIQLAAAHFNHHLRGAESNRDEKMVRKLCNQYEIPLTVGQGQVVSGKKGLEAAARDARYEFLRSLPGKIATAHTADDNAETVLMHLVRGTGLKGLGGIAPVSGNVIRPMLSITRQEVEAFLDEWHVMYVFDSSNGTDAFLRNRLRRHVMPLLQAENPSLAENISAMALQLRQDADYLAQQVPASTDVEALRAMHPALRTRALEQLLKDSGVKEPERSHISQAEALVFSDKPSAFARFPGGVTIARNYGRLEVCTPTEAPEAVALPCPGTVRWGDYRITCTPAEAVEHSSGTFAVAVHGPIQVRSRLAGDSIRLPGGTRQLKKLFIDRKIPAAQRPFIPVLADERGVLGVYGIGANLDREADALPAVRIHIEPDSSLGG